MTHAVGDLDRFSFNGSNGDNIRITVADFTAMDPRLEIRNPDGVVIYDSFCSHVCSFFTDQSLTLSGIYELAISDQNNDEPSTGYTLQLEKIPPVTSPVSLAYDANEKDAIDPVTDTDFFAFMGEAGTIVRITVADFTAMDPRLEIRDPDGVVIYDDFCSHVCSFSTDQSLTLSGIYEIAISDKNNDETSVNYEVSLQCLSGPCPTGLPPGLAECDIQMSQASYVDGETITADVFRIANLTGASQALEIKIWLGVPGASPIDVPLGADDTFVLPDGTDVDLGPVPLLPVTAALARGGYEFSCRMLNPTTGRLLREDRNFFDLQ